MRLTCDEIASLIEHDGEDLLAEADAARREYCGDVVHLRGIIEFSNLCSRNCAYCGLRKENDALPRYTMSANEILRVVAEAEGKGVRSIVLQSGEYDACRSDWLAKVIAAIKHRFDVAVTLCVGISRPKCYESWRQAGADRYLIKHETANAALYQKFHPDSQLHQRLAALECLRALGYQIGTGNIIGLPGQTFCDLASDILLTRKLDVDMAAFGPFVSHPMTPLANTRTADMSATQGIGVLEAKEMIIRTVPDAWYKQAGILDGLVDQGDTVVLVIPIDREAPKGRLILPQVQTLRDILDRNASALVTNERNLARDIANLRARPHLVITDSQAFEAVSRGTPPGIPMTSFSIVFARYKGNLDALVAGANRIRTLKETDKVLICEACTHHPIDDDIGRKKIPCWLRARVGPGLRCDVVAGHDFSDDLAQYALVIHCGACMFNRREMLSRIIACQEQGIPITNYGVAIAYMHGILDRAVAPFQCPAALSTLCFARGGARAF